MTLVKEIYLITEQLPSQEKFGLVSQIRRCAISIPSNIAEGQKRLNRAETIQFTGIALGSAAELETQLILIEQLYDIPTQAEVDSLLDISRMLSSLVRSLRT